MSIINNALSGSLAAQLALGTTSQNIANLKTPGYTRQGVLLASLRPSAGVLSAGSGVEVSSLIRFSDGYKSQQMWRAASAQAQFAQPQPYLTQLEQVMGDEQSSISSGVDAFFAALNASAVDPTSTPLRQAVVTSADAMAQHFNSINSVLNGQLLSVHQQADAMIPQINTATANIAALNGKIAAANAGNTNVSGLIDARDQAIDALAGMVSLEVVDQADGTRDVSLKSGQSLVIGNLSGKMSSTTVDTEQTFSVTFASSTFDINTSTIGGALGGLGAFEKNTLKPLQASVSDIAEQLASNINTQLAAGFTTSATAGKPLLTFTSGSGSNMLSLASGFKAEDLAFSSSSTTPGDTGNLQILVGIKNQPITLTSVGSVLLGDADTQLVGKLGIDSQQNQASLATADTVREQSVADWQSTSGVNSDEEAVNLVEYQQMYNANMKVIAVANSLFDATLAMFG